MRLLRSRLVYNDGEACLQANGTPASQILSRLERDERPSAILAASSLDPGDLIAALAADALGDDQSQGPTLTQASPPPPSSCRSFRSPPGRPCFPGRHEPAG